MPGPFKPGVDRPDTPKPTPPRTPNLSLWEALEVALDPSATPEQKAAMLDRVRAQRRRDGS